MEYIDDPEEVQVLQLLSKKLPQFIKDALPFALKTGKRYFYVFCVLKNSQDDSQRIRGFLEMAVSDKCYESSDSLALVRHRAGKRVSQMMTYDLSKDRSL